jgi:CHAT domain-containing protein/Tfp pilus assembly protein PilF
MSLKQPFNYVPAILQAISLLLAPIQILALDSARDQRVQYLPVNVAFLEDKRTLALSTSHDAEIAGGETHSYFLALEKQQFARVSVAQRGLDLTLRLLAPDGKQLTDVNNPNGAQESEQISLIAPDSGQYTIEIRTRRKDVTRGPYSVRLEELRVPTPQDETSVAAERITAEAELLIRNQRTGELLQQASVKYQQALAAYRTIKVPQAEVGILNQLGEIYIGLSEYEKAVEHLEQGLALLDSHTDLAAKSRIVFNLGKGYSSLGDTEKAFELYSEALTLSRQNNSRSLEAQALSNLGGVLGRMGEWGKALDHFNQVRALYQSAKNTRAEVSSLFNIGVALSNMGEKQGALDMYNQALQIMRALKYPFGESYALYNIATVYNSMNEPQKALGLLNEALTLSQTAGDRSQEARVVNELGRAYNLQGEKQKALELYQQALKLNSALSHRENEAIVLREMAILYLSLGVSSRASDALKRVVSIARTIKNPEVEANALFELSGIALDSRNLVEARTNIENSIALIESIRSGVSSEDLRSSYFAKVREYYDRYIEILMHDHAQRPAAGLDAVALQVSERARARGMLELLDEARVDVREGIDPSLLKQERNLHQRLNAKEAQRTQLLSSQANSPRLATVEKELADLISEYHNLRARIRTASPRYADLTQPKQLSVSEIQELLDQDTLLLEYILGDKKSYLWAVSTSSMRSFELPGRESVEIASRAVLDSLTARNQKIERETPRARRARIAKADADFYETAGQLSKVLLGPAVEFLGNKRLLIVAEGALQYLPFAALPVPAKTTARTPSVYLPLTAKHEVVILPSVSVLTALRQNHGRLRADPKTVAVIADPIFSANYLRVSLNKPAMDATISATLKATTRSDVKRSADDLGLDGFARLPFSRREADEISAIVPANKRMVAVDFAASKQTATSQTLSRYSVLHFATHGLLNSQRPELSGLVFSLVDENGNSQDGFLRLHEIFNLKLGADLVVLSACQTALGREIRGEGLVGLTRGFMYAGVPRVVAGLWRVDDRATAQLMGRFYRKMLIDGAKPSEALRSAQQSLAKEERWKSPYYWAPFVMQGDWR